MDFANHSLSLISFLFIVVCLIICLVSIYVYVTDTYLLSCQAFRISCVRCKLLSVVSRSQAKRCRIVRCRTVQWNECYTSLDIPASFKKDDLEKVEFSKLGSQAPFVLPKFKVTHVLSALLFCWSFQWNNNKKNKASESSTREQHFSH